MKIQGKLADFFLDKVQISLNDGAEFGNQWAGFVRMNLALTKENLKLALDRMEKTING